MIDSASKARSNPKPKFWRSPVIRLGGSGLILTLLLTVLPFHQVWAAMKRIPPLLGLGLLCAYLVLHLLGVVKWRLLINTAGADLTFSQSVRCYYGGLFGNIFLPSLVGGDLVRGGMAFLVSRSRAAIVLGSLTDRVQDVIGLLGVTTIGVLLLPTSLDYQSHKRLWAVGITLLVASALGLGSLLVLPARKFPFKIRRIMAKLRRGIRSMYGRPGRMLTAFSLGMALQVCQAGINYWLGEASGLHLAFNLWLFAWPLAKLSALIPITQGGIGVREAALVGLLAPFGAPPAFTAAVGLLFQAIVISGGLIAGLIALLIGRVPSAQTKPPQYISEFAKDGIKTPNGERSDGSPVTVSPENPAKEKGQTIAAPVENARPPVTQHVVILGAGPAGVGAAYQLVRKGIARVTVLEQRDGVGGNAGSFELDGVYCDFGSHRLHPVAKAEIMDDLRRLLGKDLLYQTRHGRILLQGRWIHFPLKPMDLLLRLPKTFAMSVLADMVRKVLPRDDSGPKTFATVLERGLGRTICREFYFPYARKLWGVHPEELAVTTAQRRVSGSSLVKILRKVAAQVPGLKPPGAGRFYYPRRGYGQISQCLFEAAREAGAEFKFGARVTAIEREAGRIKAVRYQLGGEEFEVPTRIVWSTIPISLLVKGMRPEPPNEVLEAASSITFRGMILIYLLLDQDRFSSFDAYYFPQESTPISRLSEPKNFSAASEPRGRTVLCAELPSDPGRPEWEMSDQELGRRVCDWLGHAGLPTPTRVSKVVTRRLRQAYPLYRRGYEECFSRMDRWLSEIEGVLTFGRQGLFAHDNTHHALAMAYAAAACLSPEGRFDHAHWAEHREEFETHVVED